MKSVCTSLNGAITLAFATAVDRHQLAGRALSGPETAWPTTARQLTTYMPPS